MRLPYPTVEESVIDYVVVIGRDDRVLFRRCLGIAAVQEAAYDAKNKYCENRRFPDELHRKAVLTSHEKASAPG